MDSIFTDLSRFLPSQSIEDTTSMAKLNLAKRRLDTSAKAADGAKNSALSATDDARLKKACLEFEAIFIKQMLDAMRKTVDKSNDLLPQTTADNIFNDMLYDEYSRKMAMTGHFGIADMLYNQFTEKTVQPTG